MDLIFKIKHYTNKFLYTFLGPADLDEANDPVARLDRQWRERFGEPEPAKASAAVGSSPAESTPKAIA